MKLLCVFLLILVVGCVTGMSVKKDEAATVSAVANNNATVLWIWNGTSVFPDGTTVVMLLPYRTYLFVLADKAVAALAATTGKLLWMRKLATPMASYAEAFVTDDGSTLIVLGTKSIAIVNLADKKPIEVTYPGGCEIIVDASESGQLFATYEGALYFVCANLDTNTTSLMKLGPKALAPVVVFTLSDLRFGGAYFFFDQQRILMWSSYSKPSPRCTTAFMRGLNDGRPIYELNLYQPPVLPGNYCPVLMFRVTADLSVITMTNGSSAIYSYSSKNGAEEYPPVLLPNWNPGSEYIFSYHLIVGPSTFPTAVCFSNSATYALDLKYNFTTYFIDFPGD